ncbi:Fe-S cluster assembly protein SufD [Flavobacteriaceae bacterium]|jgi:Fe-S cluster assembly protein SufD|nr:Fe-S cluster assembly protein SufD [Flavobacteriaceae bacterium]MDA7710711.1 Fe-S cluster assembly protein SufD [Flavobacteriaceae bacterium]MDA8969926.1 Fe-S cluster assembly protein SufD [bacterium]MDA8993196.1 Fe-S cluster assembly protein SufD [Flavobacteriaceae bacterium]MDB4306819.1 Fe-S cluster assembly protein SufD [Flavobacteriaceae bacterium]
MDFQDKLISSYLAFEEGVNLSDSVHKTRAKALKYFEETGFPTRKDESWKYTSLAALINQDYSLFPKSESTIELRDVKKYFLYDTDTYKVIFIDGVYSPFLSNTTHDGLDVCLMSAALTKPKYRELINTYFNKIAPANESLTALNTSYAKEGAYIYIPPSVVAEKPIEIIHFASGNETSLWMQPRNLIVVDKNAQVQIIERHQSLKAHAVVTNSVTEIFVHQDAFLDYYKLQNDLESASLIDNTYITQEKNSHASVHTFSLGGKLIRNNLNFYHKGEHILSTLKGVTILEDQQHVDHSTLVHHAQPNCESHQDYKGIFSDRSEGVFNGKIVVDKVAQKTNAFQQNNNILLENKATINTKPQLEIFADDVKCSHGCTVGQLDEEALFYLRSRGIPKKEAKALLTYAFANTVLNSVQLPSLKKRINLQIAKKLGVNLGFEL